MSLLRQSRGWAHGNVILRQQNAHRGIKLASAEVERAIPSATHLHAASPCKSNKRLCIEVIDMFRVEEIERRKTVERVA